MWYPYENSPSDIMSSYFIVYLGKRIHLIRRYTPIYWKGRMPNLLKNMSAVSRLLTTDIFSSQIIFPPGPIQFHWEGKRENKMFSCCSGSEKRIKNMPFPGHFHGKVLSFPDEKFRKTSISLPVSHGKRDSRPALTVC